MARPPISIKYDLSLVRAIDRTFKQPGRSMASGTIRRARGI
jgi:hypothetical protein